MRVQRRMVGDANTNANTGHTHGAALDNLHTAQAGVGGAVQGGGEGARRLVAVDAANACTAPDGSAGMTCWMQV
jgi:hypothetical protein